MALPVQTQAKYWAIATVVLVLALWFLGDVILPFVLGGAIAYCLDPIADWFESHGFTRALSVVIITLIALLCFVVVVLLVIPVLFTQAAQLVETTPQILRNLQSNLAERFPQLLEQDSAVRQQLIAIGESLSARGTELLNTLFTSALGVINLMVLVVIVPVVTFYLLLDWDRMVSRIDELLPRDHAPTVRRIASDIDNTLASFIRGQGTVCLILGSFYAIALMIVGLQFGLVVGAIAGLITFIPYVGALVGGVLAIGLALFQFWGGTQVIDGVETAVATDWLRIGLVGLIFMIGQFLEGNILTPKLVGSSVGLHPVWLLFALSVFGTLFGFVGMLVAVPVAAMLGVVARFFIEQYLGGRLYRGLSGTQND